jgi:hypothetical protein
MNLLTFGKGNAKLAPNIFTFSLPAGKTCPGAKHCKSQCVLTSGGYRIKDGPDCKVRCFAAINEVMLPSVRKSRNRNLDLLTGKTVEEMVELITASLPQVHWEYKMRVGVSGDYFSQAYFDSWLNVAQQNPETVFYGYTKSLPFWVARLGEIPDNFRLVASRGGKYDHLIEPYNLPECEIVLSEQEAADKGIEIDHDDSHVFDYKGKFALLIHGAQPAGTPASTAWQALKKSGRGGYKNKKGWYVQKKRVGVLPSLVGAVSA